MKLYKIIICICSSVIILSTSYISYNYINNTICSNSINIMDKKDIVCEKQSSIEPFNIRECDVIKYTVGVNLKNASPSSSYIIKKGDTLYNIANHYMSWCSPSIGVQKIVKLNNLKNTNLSIGQHLLIPRNTAELSSN